MLGIFNYSTIFVMVPHLRILWLPQDEKQVEEQMEPCCLVNHCRTSTVATKPEQGIQALHASQYDFILITVISAPDVGFYEQKLISAAELCLGRISNATMIVTSRQARLKPTSPLF